MPSIFDDILERAEKLHSEAKLGSLSELPSFLKSEKTVIDSPFKFEAGLQDVFRQSEEMWKKKKLSQDVNNSISELKISKDVQQLRATALTASQIFNKQNELKKNCLSVEKTSSLGKTAIYDEFSSKEIEQYVERSFERARIESERTFFNQQLVDHSDFLPDQENTINCDPFNQIQGGTPIAPGSNLNQPLAYVENVFAYKIDVALYKNCKVVIKSALKSAVEEINDKEITNIWQKAFAICNTSLIENLESVVDLRLSRKWFEHVIDHSTLYLHKCYKDHMEAVVENALEIANRGGVPGTIPLVEAYLNVKNFSYSAIEDGHYNKHPIWSVLFNSLRIGDLNAVAEISKKLFNVSRCSILIGVLANLHNTKRIDPETKIKLNAEWRQCSSLCHDVFKKAVYGALLGFDCPEVNGTIEDWLWARLIYCKLYPKDLISSFRLLQNTVCAEFGENYFVHNGGSYSIYYAALILTGQLEQAIGALFRGKLFVHAVHISILAYQLKLLVLVDKVSSDILTMDVHNPTVCQLNFARLVLLYIKNFELTNINYALNYSFFLNNLELDVSIDNKGGRNIFKSCLSRIVYLTNEKDQILGSLNVRGERVPGLIDKFSSAFSVSDLIGYVAADTNSCGQILEACKLYALADKPNEAIRLTCCHMSFCISAAAKNCGDNSLKETIDFATWLANYYQSKSVINLEKHNLSTLLILINLFKFFQHIANQKYDKAIEVIRRLKFIPVNLEEVQSYVCAFEMVPEEVRLLLSEICTALMKAIVALHEAEPVDSSLRLTLAEQARALINYSARIPYRFPVSTNSSLLQLQAKIA